MIISTICTLRCYFDITIISFKCPAHAKHSIWKMSNWIPSRFRFTRFPSRFFHRLLYYIIYLYTIIIKHNHILKYKYKVNNNNDDNNNKLNPNGKNIQMVLFYDEANEKTERIITEWNKFKIKCDNDINVVKIKLSENKNI